MAHAHDHHHDSNYFLEQLCTIGASGALGVVSILMYEMRGYNGKVKLEYILDPKFFLPVLLGGITLMALIAVRAVFLWREAGQTAGHAHEHHHHEHDHGHAHEHDHCEEHGDCHDHDHAHDHGHNHVHAHAGHEHGHEHGWAPWRYAVLMLPVGLYCLNLPNSSFSPELSQGDLVAPVDEVKSKGDGVVDLKFNELARAANFPEQREELEGKNGRLKGMFSAKGLGPKEFTLYRVKMKCCAADAIPIQVRIICKENITRNFEEQTWVEVVGQIQFRKMVGHDKFVPVLVVKSDKDIEKMDHPLSDYDID